MKVAIMQPYLFPYIGYFQLIMSSDIFVIYDDVNFIKQGYINRNNILFNSCVQRITLPVLKASSNKYINQLSFSGDVENILITIRQAYCKSKYFNQVFPIIENILRFENRSIPHLIRYSLDSIFNYLGLYKKIIFSSDLNYDRGKSASEKLVSICKSIDCNFYINSPGGRMLYDKTMFEPFGVELKFIEPIIKPYPQLNTNDFISHLSIIDILMNNDRSIVVDHISNFLLKE